MNELIFSNFCNENVFYKIQTQCNNKEVDGNNSKAEESKAMGNAAYSEKRFDEALQHYSDAIHHDSTNILYYLNRSAVHFSMQNYGKCFFILLY